MQRAEQIPQGNGLKQWALCLPLEGNPDPFHHASLTSTLTISAHLSSHKHAGQCVCVCVFQGGIDQIISTPRPLSKAWNSVYQWSGIQLVCCIWVQEWLITLDAQQVWETREPTKFVVNVLIRMTVGTAKLLSSNQWDFLIRHYFEGISTKERPRLFLINFWRQKGTNYYAFLLKHKYSSVRCVKKTKTQWDRVWYTN